MTDEVKGEGTPQKTTSNSEEVKTEDESKTKTEEVKTEEVEVEEEETGGEEETPEKPREARFVPYDKFKDSREKIKTLEAKVKELSERPDSAGTDDAIKKLSEKYPEVGEEFLKDIIAASREGSKLPTDIVEKLKKVEQHEQRIIQDTGFEKEYSKLIKDVPEADDPKVKSKLKTLAFTEEFAKTPLKAVYYGNPDDFETIKPKKSAEPSKGGQANVGEMTFKEIDELPDTERAAAIKSMDKPTFEKFSEHLRTNKSFRNR